MPFVYDIFVVAITVEFKLELLEMDEFCTGLGELDEFVKLVLFVKFEEILALLVFREEFE